MMDGRKVILAQILLNEHPVHGGRCTEGGDVIFGKHGQDLLSVKPVKIIDKDRTLAEPLTVELAPKSLAPTGFGDGKVQAVPLTQMPVTGSNVVAKSIFVRMHRHLGIAGGTGGKEHQHGIVTAGGILRPDKTAAEQTVFFVKIVPAVTAAAHQNLSQLHAADGFC